jgi:hypothetical protein
MEPAKNNIASERTMKILCAEKRQASEFEPEGRLGVLRKVYPFCSQRPTEEFR